MGKCERCGNEYDKAFRIQADGKEHVFDCFECAIAELAPTCDTCGIAVIGHGIEAGGKVYCCGNCARRAGATEIRDRA